ncbi:MAG: Gfo/Idh/MocA family oxidoreductase [Clostridium sp.]|uniref:Gfo/Idh/MocA family oxidoreductase n=1 Tax=Clostridium sp. TaxID=1506 RepID=UPI0025C01987|nr:Gfo/Idh/MocA family oxidoreductase [Clostridium sp.]MCH3964800.1 Gfo/Idh/MocA family oxidoreductase [Clostridium sp.]MCI1715271.1 Gfo/Idh/MocA family oxidoreductase [Clostridium sp.]MCI1799533.1 Gfo/Idh/MocA family oxidoreductase [Clostridium sp.]MCI1813454.1 Gfo/Idh/MocA family oxidoreductase [Clostridium sp.]MCI1870345.1 Gfo/Idh/MocA family oxidoreductase [Clostridium sp.]
MDKVKIAVVGVGALGEMHAANIQNKIANAEVVAICDGKDRAEKVKKELNIKYAYTDFDEMMKNDEIDALVIATSVAAHKYQAIRACEKQIHVFCEKPVGKTTGECLEIEKAVKKNGGKIFTVGFMRRFDPSYAAAMQKIREGVIGEPIFFRGYSLDPITVVPFHLQRQREGNAASFFKEMSVHDVDLSRWYLGGDFESVYVRGGGYVYKEFEKYRDVDNGWSMVNFKNGRCAFIYCGRTAPQCDVESEIVGTEGTIRIGTNPNRTRMQIYKNFSVIDESLTTFFERWEQAFLLEMQNFANCIQQGTFPEITAHDGTMASISIDMLQESYESNKIIYDGFMLQK